MQLKSDIPAQKLRGAYYTPSAIASFILRWGMVGNADADMLEPSCGDGSFLRQIVAERMPFGHLTAVEFDKGEADKARAVGLRDCEVINDDFHRFCMTTQKRFDFIFGNPPFIRYQNYSKDQQLLADGIFRNAGLKRSKLTNAWAAFVVGCSLLLKERGKMAFVLPTDLLQVGYAKQIRDYLVSNFNRIVVVSFKRLAFEGIQQDVLLLLCDRTGTTEHRINFIEVEDADVLQRLSFKSMESSSKHIDTLSDKWNHYFLDREELDFLNGIKAGSMHCIGSYANVEVGITTGSNHYFTVPQSTVEEYGLQDYSRPLVGRNAQLSGLSFMESDWHQNVVNGDRANLLVFLPGVREVGDDGVRSYIAYGEQQGIDKGYKTGIRDDWYVIPSIKLSDAFFLCRSDVYPTFSLNQAQAYATSTLHRVSIKEGVDHRALVVSYYNSLSFAFAEILGRKFGGGALELMPSEVEGIFLPYRDDNGALFDEVDQMVRSKKAIDEILAFTDMELLHNGMGFSVSEVEMARRIWRKLLGHRLHGRSFYK